VDFSDPLKYLKKSDIFNNNKYLKPHSYQLENDSTTTDLATSLEFFINL